MHQARVDQRVRTFGRRRSSRRAVLQGMAGGIAVGSLVIPFSARARTATPTAPGSLVDIGDRRLFLSCSGTGSPTVILESGLSDSSAVWSAVQGAVAITTRICSYDRANVPGGASDPSDSHTSAPRLRSAAELVADLHALLSAADVPGPYVFVGHSVGGLVVRLYAATHPQEVVGMVLVDATHEDNWSWLEAEIGPDVWPTAVSQFTQAVAAGILEPLDLEATAAQVREARESHPLHSMPLVVLTHTQPPDAATLLPGLSVEASERRWGEQQADLVTLLPDSRQIRAEGSGHYIQRDRPDLVIEAITDVVEAVRDPSSWGTLAVATPTSNQVTSSAFEDVLQAGINQGLIGVALYVDQGDVVVFDGVAGLANRETDKPLVPADRFRIYSITKTFTAVLVLQLVDDGVLTLDDTVSQWLDDPVVARIPSVDLITIRHLLTHTSGVYDYYNGADSSFVDDAITGEGADWSKVWAPQEVLAYVDGTRHAADFSPGQGINYSDTGYILLGLIVEQASGQSFTDQLHTRILNPLGLTDTFIAAAEPVPGGAVEGYHRLGDELINVSGINLSWAWTQGGMVSTTGDLGRFADALFGGGLIEPMSLETMLTFLPADQQGREWGMGVARVQTPMGGLIGMNGSGPGFVARLYRLPTGATIVLLTNTNPEDDSVNTIFAQAVRVALRSVTAMSFPGTSGRNPEETL
jgi:D-alanyl-D-alanine carboxypeptidase